VPNIIAKAISTIARTALIPLCATSLKDFFYLVFYSLIRLAAIPLYYLNSDFYNKFLRAVHNALPDIVIKTKCGRFFCAAGTDSISFALPIYEKELTKFLEKSFNDGGVFIDAGAHIGRYSIMLGRKFGNRGQVLALEPSPATFNFLEKNIKLNNIGNIRAFQNAVLDKNCKANFFVSKESGMNSLFNSPADGIKIKVSCKRLDDLVKEKKIFPKDVSLIKIDVEGAPDKVLLGAEEILKKSRAKIIFEALDNEELVKCKNILERFGYKIDENVFDNINFFAEKVDRKI